MPANVVKTSRDERHWKRAKEQAAKQGHAKDYAYIMGIFKRMSKSGAMVGGKADGRKPEDFDAKALAEGTNHELEHTRDRKVAREIAMDHLAEDPRYYEKLSKIEKGDDPGPEWYRQQAKKHRQKAEAHRKAPVAGGGQMGRWRQERAHEDAQEAHKEAADELDEAASGDDTAKQDAVDTSEQAGTHPEANEVKSMAKAAGDRGGKVVGQTASGKPIYERRPGLVARLRGGIGARDLESRHRARSRKHSDKAAQYRDQGNHEAAARHMRMAHQHADHAEQVRKESGLMPELARSVGTVTKAILSGETTLTKALDGASHELRLEVLRELRKAKQASLPGTGAGEGSRGGRVIGHTRGGHPIYAGSKKAQPGRAKKPPHEVDYANQRLIDYHVQMAGKHTRHGQELNSADHREAARAHWAAAGSHESAKRGAQADDHAVRMTQMADAETGKVLKRGAERPSRPERKAPTSEHRDYHRKMMAYHNSQLEQLAFAPRGPGQKANFGEINRHQQAKDAHEEAAREHELHHQFADGQPDNYYQGHQRLHAHRLSDRAEKLSGEMAKSMKPTDAKKQVIGRTDDGKDVYGMEDELKKKDAQKAKVAKAPAGNDPKQDPEDPPGQPGTHEHHRDQALAHLQAAQAHATAASSAKKVEEAKEHKDVVSAAQAASQAAVPVAMKKGGFAVHQSEDDLIAALMGADMVVGGQHAGLYDVNGAARLEAMRKGVAGGTIYQGEHDAGGSRGGDYRELVARAQVAEETEHDDPAGNRGNGGLAQWFADAWDGQSDVNVPLGFRGFRKALDAPLEVVDDDPTARARQGQAGEKIGLKLGQ